MKIKSTTIDSTTIDSATGEVTTEFWEMPLFGPDTFAQAWKARCIEMQGPSPTLQVFCPHWSFMSRDQAAVVVHEHHNGRLELIATGFVEVAA